MDNIGIFITGTIGLIVVVLGGSYAYASYNDPTSNRVVIPTNEAQGLSGGSKTRSKKRLLKYYTRKHKKN
jgi:hypothetical protein